MILGVIIQQPTDILDYDIGYTKWVNDTVESTEVNILPSDGTLNVSAQVPPDTSDTVKLWIQGGEHGEQYTVEINTVLASGRNKQDELIVQIEDFR